MKIVFLELTNMVYLLYNVNGIYNIDITYIYRGEMGNHSLYWNAWCDLFGAFNTK